MINDLALLRLLQLVSPGLPIGLYSYSQGLEGAVEEQLVTNSDQAYEWIDGLLEQGLTQIDLPVLVRLYMMLGHQMIMRKLSDGVRP